MVLELADAHKVVGVKQVRRALSAGQVRKVFLAQDADSRITGPIADLCLQTGVEKVFVPSMKELGRSCGIPVGAATAALLS